MFRLLWLLYLFLFKWFHRPTSLELSVADSLALPHPFIYNSNKKTASAYFLENWSAFQELQCSKDATDPMNSTSTSNVASLLGPGHVPTIAGRVLPQWVGRLYLSEELDMPPWEPAGCMEWMALKVIKVFNTNKQDLRMRRKLHLQTVRKIISLPFPTTRQRGIHSLTVKSGEIPLSLAVHPSVWVEF